VSYRAVLAGAALTQFGHLLADQELYAEFMDRLVTLRDAPASPLAGTILLSRRVFSPLELAADPLLVQTL
jgi:hypothetical protein